MQYDEKKALSEIRLQKAKDCLKDARSLIDTEGYRSSVNRSYYAVFHGMRSVLVFDDFDSKKHSGIISEFRKRYIKTNIFDDTISKIIGNQFDTRSHSDYDDFYFVSENFAITQLSEAERVIIEIEKYLNSKQQ